MNELNGYISSFCRRAVLLIGLIAVAAGCSSVHNIGGKGPEDRLFTVSYDSWHVLDQGKNLTLADVYEDSKSWGYTLKIKPVDTSQTIEYFQGPDEDYLLITDAHDTVLIKREADIIRFLDVCTRAGQLRVQVVESCLGSGCSDYRYVGEIIVSTGELELSAEPVDLYDIRRTLVPLDAEIERFAYTNETQFIALQCTY